MKSRDLNTAAIAMLCVFAVGGYVLKLRATPATGVTRTFVSRGTFDCFMVNAELNTIADHFQYIAKAQPGMDLEVDTHSYTPLGSTGWHKHPGPVYITVTSGQITFYEYDDARCSPHVYNAGEGFVDYGNGHIGVNEDPNHPASDVTVAVTYVGGPFRTELPAGNTNCSF